MYLLLLFLATLAGGSVPLWWRGLTEGRMQLVMAFSGAFLLAITFLHLLPESFSEIGGKAGFYLLIGFFLQLIIQRFSHGIEHGHVHLPANDHHGHSHALSLVPVLAGLGLHAFMEGIPLGFEYRQPGTEHALYAAVIAHKMPEAALIGSLAAQLKGRRQGWLVLLIFATLTPVGSLLATYFGHQYMAMSRAVMALIPVVAGAFVHISTTIFFESGTKQHALTRSKTIAIIAGLALGVVTLWLE